MTLSEQIELTEKRMTNAVWRVMYGKDFNDWYKEQIEKILLEEEKKHSKRRFFKQWLNIK